MRSRRLAPLATIVAVLLIGAIVVIVAQPTGPEDAAQPSCRPQNPTSTTATSIATTSNSGTSITTTAPCPPTSTSRATSSSGPAPATTITATSAHTTVISGDPGCAALVTSPPVPGPLP